MSKSLKEGEVEELKTRSDIADVIGGYVSLKKRGKNFVGLCPFHQEKTPSFTVDSIKQLYHCFGCGEGGDVISFLMKIENMEFLEAVEFLANKTGYKLTYSTRESSTSRKFKEKLLDLNELAKKYYHYVLFNSKAGGAALEYLENRGFNKKTIERFQVGYSLNSWEQFCSFARKRNYSPTELIEAGMAIKSKKGRQEIYDRFRGRIMFPIEDVVGKTIGFGARILNPGADRQSAKYINTPETKLYSKSKNIYNIYRAKNAIVEQNRALIVEGYTDVMALFQNGIQNVVASLGTALTSEQIKLLGRFTQNIVLVFDSDQAGMSASLKGMDRLKEYNHRLDLFNENNMSIEVAILEKGYDPADYTFKRGSSAFLDQVRQAENIIDFTLDTIMKKHDISNINGKLRASNELLKFILTLSSKIIQEECIKKVSRKLDLKESLLFEELVKMGSSSKKNTHTPGGKLPEKNEAPYKKLEIEALRLMINGEGLTDGCFLGLDESYFRFEDTRKLFNILSKLITDYRKASKKINFPVEITSDYLEEEAVQKLYNTIYFDSKPYKNGRVNCKEVLKNLKLVNLLQEIDRIRSEMLKIEERKKKGETGTEIQQKYNQLCQKHIKLVEQAMAEKIT
ncbi:MAG: DNA primase [Actinomycetota bacterium]